MKQSIQKIIIAAVLFAAGLSQNAAAEGYAFVAGEDLYAATNYPAGNPAGIYARHAAEYDCVEDEDGGDYSMCSTALGRDVPENIAFAVSFPFIRAGGGILDAIGAAGSISEAIGMIETRCNANPPGGNANICSAISANALACGDGTAFGTPNDCTSNFDDDTAGQCPTRQTWDGTGCLWTAETDCDSATERFVADTANGGGTCEPNSPTTPIAPITPTCDDDNTNPNCTCPGGEERVEVDNVQFCITGFRTFDYRTDVYTESSCFGAGWEVVYDVDTMNRFVQCCGFAITRNDEPVSSGTAVARQVDNGENVDFCIMAMNDGFDAADAGIADIPFCEDPTLFDNDGFVQNPGLAEGERLQLVVNDNGPNTFFRANGNEVMRYVPSAGGGGSSSSTGLIIGGVAVVGGLIWLLSSGGEEGEFNFSHDFGYSATKSGYSANAGGRMDFRKDNWHLYFSGDGNANGEFRYQSGGSYTADFWTAEFSESVSGKTADYDLSLSSDFGSGIWKLSPTYRLHSEYADSEFDTQNELNLESVLRYNRWTIRPSAGFRWENANDFSKNARFQINAIHRF